MKKKYFFASVKSLKIGVGSRAGSEPRYSEVVTDPQHWLSVSFIIFGSREVVEVSDTEGEERAGAVAASSHQGMYAVAVLSIPYTVR